MGPTDRVSVTCVVCRRETPRAILRYGGAQGYLHPRGAGHADCRLVVVPDPLADDDWVYAAPADISVEAAVDQLLRESAPVRWRDRAGAIRRAWLHILEDRPAAVA